MNETFAETLKRLRGKRGLTQVDCAKLLEVPLRTYCDWERGETEPAIIAQEGAIQRLERHE